MPDVFDFAIFPVLTTERLRLRRLTYDDADALMAIFGDPQVLRYLNDEPMDTPEKARGLVDWVDDQFNQHKGVNWGITLKGDDYVIGMCGNYAWHRGNRRVDIGYHLLPLHWGRGYATEATRANLAWCFENLNVHRVQADCTDGNLASERVLLKCGFKVEGIWRESCWEHGRFVDIKQFGLLRREFEALGK
jgi:ribosomal-protein-alanine N-acetyltransferase